MHELQLDQITANLLEMGRKVELSMAGSLRSLCEGRRDIGRRVLAEDRDIRSLGGLLEAAVVGLLSTQQPVTAHVRFVLGASTISAKLVRVQSHVVDVAQASLLLAPTDTADPPAEVREMSGLIREMLGDLVGGLAFTDCRRCMSVIRNNDVMEDLNRKSVRSLVGSLRQGPHRTDEMLKYIRVSRSLESAAHLAASMADDVMRMAESRVAGVRHDGAAA